MNCNSYMTKEKMRLLTMMINYDSNISWMRKIYEETLTKAEQSELFYVLLFWDSTISSEVDYRRAYFQENSEAVAYREQLIATMDKYKFKYQIYSSTEDIYGGLV